MDGRAVGAGVRVAWALAGLTVVLVLVDVAVTAQYRSLLSEEAVAVHGFPFVSGAVLGCSVMGALVVTRYQRQPIGWLLLLIGTSSAVSLLAEAYAVWVSGSGGPGSAVLASLAGWTAALVGGQLAISAAALMFLLAPDGRLLSPRWRWAAAIAVLGEACHLAAVLSTDPLTFDVDSRPEDVGRVTAVLFSAGILLIGLALLASLVSMLLRLRRSHGEQRRQLRLIAVAAATMTVGMVVLLVVTAVNGGEQTWAAAMPLFVAFFLLPILFAVAVLRYRLFDIEVILNRTVVLAIATAFAAVGYTTLVVTIGSFVDSRTRGFGASLVSLVVVAVAFQPLRRSVVRVANRLAHGPRAQPYEELSDFSRRLAAAPTPETLLPVAAAAAGQALSARGARATLSPGGAAPLSATWGLGVPEGAPTYAVPVRSGGAALGLLEISVPRGRRLRDPDRRRLEALADQTAVAFRNVALEAELADRVGDLDRTTRDLASSRTRIIAADDEVRRILEAAISREVLPHMVTVSDRLRSRQPASPEGIEDLVTGVNAALEALRDLTRGVFPTQLARAGLEPALRSHLARRHHLVTLSVAPSAAGLRFPARVEAAAYFGAVEATGSRPGPVGLELAVVDAELTLTVRGVTDADVDLPGVLDRVAAADGTVTVADGLITLRLPVSGERPAYAAR